MKRSVSLGTRLALASVLFALLIGIVFGALVFAVVNLRASTEREARAQNRTVATLTLERRVLDLETGARVYVITLNERFLAPWREARRALPQSLREFTRVFAGTTEVMRARELAQLVRFYRDEYSIPIVNSARRNPAAARLPVATLEGQKRIAAIQSRFTSLLAAEGRASKAEAMNATTRARHAIAVTIAGLFSTATLLIAFGIYLRGAVTRPIRAAADGASAIAGGDLDTRVKEMGPGEVGQLTRAFNAMAARLQQNRLELEEQNARLRESERLKSELISIVSHELRTPLASILGFTSLLRSRELDDVSRRRYLQIIDEQGKRLATLLNDFLDAQRVEEGRLDLAFEPVDVAALLREQTQLFEGQSEHHRIELSVPESLPVVADRDRLAQVLANLLSNAIKYSPSGGLVEVSARRQDGVVHVDVRDEGIGIPDSEQSRVFTKFFRGDAGASGIGGTGLGLALSREIVEAHRGRIGFTSDAGVGSTFWLELPVETEDSNAQVESKGAT